MKNESRGIYILLALTAAILILSGTADIFGVEEQQTEVVQAVKPLKEPDVILPEEIVVDIDIEVEEDVPDSLNALLVGFDASEGLTDVMMVGCLDTQTNELKVVSVPRDLYIDFRSDEYKHIKENNPNSRVLACKLNEVYSYSGWDDRALLDVKEIISIITGIEIDYMATINIEGFEQVVEAVGGVDFYVPQDMNYYDPVADFLIDLDEGQQVLDGNHALQLVRYRKYPTADLQRIQVQQDFLIAMYHEIISDLTVEESLALTAIAYDIIDTDFGLFEVLEYAKYLLYLDADNILSKDNMMTIPSYGELIDAIWYQFISEDEKEQMLEDFFNKE